MHIDRMDRKVETGEVPIKAGASSEPVERRHRVGRGVAAGIARTAVMVALASLGILLLLPAAIAAQASSAF